MHDRVEKNIMVWRDIDFNVEYEVSTVFIKTVDTFCRSWTIVNDLIPPPFGVNPIKCHWFRTYIFTALLYKCLFNLFKVMDLIIYQDKKHICSWSYLFTTLIFAFNVLFGKWRIYFLWHTKLNLKGQQLKFGYTHEYIFPFWNLNTAYWCDISVAWIQL